MSKPMQIVSGIVGVLAVIAFLRVMDDRDQNLMRWADAYEKCVTAEYRTTPSEWYAANGSYPECDAKPYYQN